MLAIIFVCLLASMLLSALEAAVQTVSRVRVRHSATKAKRRRDRQLLNVFTTPNRLLGAILLSNSLVTLLALLLLAIYLTEWVGPWGYVLTFALCLPIYLVIELVPKAIARFFPYRFLAFFSPVLLFLYYVPGLLIAAFLHVRHQDESIQDGLNEFRNLTNVIESEGTLEPRENRTIHNLLNLRDRTVGQLMQTREGPITMHDQIETSQLLKLAVEFRREAFLVRSREKGTVRGWIAVHDLVVNPAKDSLESYLHPTRIYSTETPAVEVFRELRETGTPIAAVQDESGKFVGAICLDDLTRALLRTTSATT